MKNAKTLPITRRSFVRASIYIVASGSFAGCAHVAMTKALLFGGSNSDLEVNPEQDDAAKYLKYVHQLRETDSQYVKQACANCGHYNRKSEKNALGKCNLIPSGLVYTSGWCTAWTPAS